MTFFLVVKLTKVQRSCVIMCLSVYVSRKLCNLPPLRPFCLGKGYP